MRRSPQEPLPFFFSLLFLVQIGDALTFCSPFLPLPLCSTAGAPERFVQSSVTDFFDFMFAALPHYELCRPDFDRDVAALRQRYVFQPHRLKAVPIDGLELFARNLWTSIVTDQELNIPTQREMLATFRCSELLEKAYASFCGALTTLQLEGGQGRYAPDLGKRFVRLLTEATDSYRVYASRYESSVYLKKREELLARIDTALKPLFLTHLAAIKHTLLVAFQLQLPAALCRHESRKRIRLAHCRESSISLRPAGVAGGVAGVGVSAQLAAVAAASVGQQQQEPATILSALGGAAAAVAVVGNSAKEPVPFQPTDAPALGWTVNPDVFNLSTYLSQVPHATATSPLMTPVTPRTPPATPPSSSGSVLFAPLSTPPSGTPAKPRRRADSAKGYFFPGIP
ncbi:putative Protein SEY1 [Paratrimastix pyriformis]|uniref:Sey1/RHD3-like three-helix bundle domain-containing protein n=1 Tax=Paratrimastix pyriformis TaxID=342808 RepID=A0ABQ8UDY4_9EUKA|nr:putative Protein SEY1 [Paratrimastix pyriformis]